jgi:hypothetical protein
MSRKFLVYAIIFFAVAVCTEQIQKNTLGMSYGQLDSDRNHIITVRINDQNIEVKMENKIVYGGTDATLGIQRAVNFFPDGGEVYLYNGTYDISDRLNLTEGTFLHGQGNSTVLDFTSLAENKSAIALGEGAHLSDIKITGSLSPLPRDFTQAVRTSDDTIIENVSIHKMGYGIDTTKSKNVTLSDIECKFIQSVRDWAACIHASNTVDLVVNRFTVADSNRGVELDARAKNVTVQNGDIIRVKNFNNTGHEAFSLDAHSHDGEGGVDDIVFKDVTIKDSYAPSVKVASEQISMNGNYATKDLPRKVLFENITVINPNSSWQVNGDDIALKDNNVINSKHDILILYKNSRNVLVQNTIARPVSADKCLICNTPRDSNIKNLSVINNTAIVDSGKVGPTMAFYGVEGLDIIENRILNAPRSTDAIRTETVSDLNLVDNNVSYQERAPVNYSNTSLESGHFPLNVKYSRTDSILHSLKYDKSLGGREGMVYKISGEFANDSTKEYKNETYGITLKYPSEWRRVDWRSLPDFISFYDVNPDDNFTEVVQFYSRYQGSSDRYAEGIDIAVQNLTQTNSLNEYSSQALDYYKQYSDFQLESQDEDLFLSNIPAYRLVFTFVSDGFDLKWMETGTVKHNKLYRVIFFAENQKFDEFLPVVEQIINSIEIADGIQNDSIRRS